MAQHGALQLYTDESMGIAFVNKHDWAWSYERSINADI